MVRKRERGRVRRNAGWSRRQRTENQRCEESAAAAGQVRVGVLDSTNIPPRERNLTGLRQTTAAGNSAARTGGNCQGKGRAAARSLPEDIVSGLPEVSPEGALVNPVAMSGTGRLKQHNCVCVSIMGCSLLLGSHGGPGVSTEITVIGGKNRDISLKGHQPAKVKAV